MTTDLVARLAAANPMPTGVAVADPTARRRLRLSPRRLSFAVAAALAVTVPTLAFADDIGNVLGISNAGTPVEASSLSLTHATKLNEAMQELGFPSTLQLLATRDGVRFYAVRNAAGKFCFSIDANNAGPGSAVGCEFVSNGFPSPGRPILDLSRWSKGTEVVGLAADGVASIELYDSAGAIVATVPVVDNVYLATGLPGGAGVKALDAGGAVLATWPFDTPPPLP
jgi:hypothetical protein